MRKKIGGIITIMFLISLLVVINPVNAQYTDVYVDDDYPVSEDTDGDADFRTITAALGAVDPGGIVHIAAGTYDTALGEVFSIFILQDLTLEGADATTTIIDAGGAGTAVVIGNNCTVDIRNVTLQNATTLLLVSNPSSFGTISDNIFTGSTWGIQLTNNLTDFTIDNNLITNCTDGIYFTRGKATVTHNILTGNNVNGINCSMMGGTGTIDIIDNTITNNVVGIYSVLMMAGSLTVTITGNTISGNTAVGIHSNFSLATVTTITDNIITGNGFSGVFRAAGIRDENPSNIMRNTITGNWEGIITERNTTIANNIIASNNRHGINYFSGPVTILHNTIVGNGSAGTYDGIHRSNGGSTITNNIIASNTGYGIYVGGPCANNYNDVWGNGVSDYFGVTAGADSISEDPLFVGGGDYHILLSSPCVDAGIDAGVYDDIDGDSRPLDDGFDIGADEIHPTPQVLANPIAAFMPVKNYHLRQVNTCLECITENLPEDVSEDVQTLLDEMQEHINNANTTGNSIYANNELLKALKCAEDIQEKLGITCPL